jgi:hypothetical protein
MPSPKLVRRRVDLSELDNWTRFELFHGPMSTPGEALLLAWRKHGAVLLQEWVSEKPGTRPWAWWQWEATRPRRVLNEPMAELSDWRGHDLRKMAGDILISSRGCEGMVLWLEPEERYLNRLDLLVPGEYAAVNWAEVRERCRRPVRSDPPTNGSCIRDSE